MAKDNGQQKGQQNGQTQEADLGRLRQVKHDKLKELQTGWKHVPEIVHQFGIVCMSRSHDDARNLIQNDPYLSSLADGIQVVTVDTAYKDISSTKARQLFLILQEPGSHYDEADELTRILPEELHGLRNYL